MKNHLANIPVTQELTHKASTKDYSPHVKARPSLGGLV